MVDIHSHILPNIDDGPRRIEESIRMLANAFVSGVKTIVATPHLLDGISETRIQKCYESVIKLQNIAIKKGFEITIKSGFECYICPELADEESNFSKATLNNNGRYLLMEFQMGEVSVYAKSIFANMKTMDIIPVIAHPERNLEIGRNPNILFEFISDGCIAQLNAGSILGHYGRAVRETARILLNHNLIHVVASDMHSPSSPLMSQALSAIGALIGFNKALMMIEGNPHHIIEGEDFSRDEPIPYKSRQKGIRKFFFR